MAECVLIVDDDPVQRRLLQNMVEKAGYVVVAADGGEAAVRLMTTPDGPPFECVVLDLVMPDLDGLGVLAKMREARVTIPVIVQTAHGGIDTVVSAMRAGAVDFVVKPVGAERMLVSLRNAIATRAPDADNEYAMIGRNLPRRDHHLAQLRTGPRPQLKDLSYSNTSAASRRRRARAPPIPVTATRAREPHARFGEARRRAAVARLRGRGVRDRMIRRRTACTSSAARTSAPASRHHERGAVAG
jgi:DNA-binding response OmpR family regulator